MTSTDVLGSMIIGVVYFQSDPFCIANKLRGGDFSAMDSLSLAPVNVNQRATVEFVDSVNLVSKLMGQISGSSIAQMSGLQADEVDVELMDQDCIMPVPSSLVDPGTYSSAYSC